MSTPTNRESDKFMLRLPDGMRERIKASAERNGRSMNAEIVSVLEQWFPDISLEEYLVGLHQELTLVRNTLSAPNLHMPDEERAKLEEKMSVLRETMIHVIDKPENFENLGRFVETFREINSKHR